MLVLPLASAKGLDNKERKAADSAGTGKGIQDKIATQMTALEDIE